MLGIFVQLLRFTVDASKCLLPSQAGRQVPNPLPSDPAASEASNVTAGECSIFRFTVP